VVEAEWAAAAPNLCLVKAKMGAASPRLDLISDR
jgi:hypothetical protein